MKAKVKKLFVPYLSLVLILSNFSFATTLVLCEMDGGNHKCACATSNDIGKYGLAIRSVSNSCCETRTVELANSNILEIIHNTPVNPLVHTDLINNESVNIGSFSAQECILHFDLSYHPPNSEIPILNSSLLI